ncbi:MAG: hypothetical protein WC805_00315 [Patescibacteria group bacterium]|jgi:hypothetical protein
MDTATVTLQTGVEVAPNLVAEITQNLASLLKKDPRGRSLICNLVMRCKDPTHPIFREDEDKLKDLSLLQRDGSVCDPAKEIILASVEGKGDETKLVPPVLIS